VANVSDDKARELLLKWPNHPGALWEAPDGTCMWLRAWPRPDGPRVSAPMIGSPRASHFRTRPDGMWLNLGKRGIVDAFCVECCGTIQNLNDKRSRYFVVASSLAVSCGKNWLREECTLHGKGRHPRWEHLGLARKPGTAWNLPVRYLRVLYAIPDKDYDGWVTNNVPAGFEFFCRHSSLGSYASQRMQNFLRQMSPSIHFYTQPKVIN
jgi:hypothetical protein